MNTRRATTYVLLTMFGIALIGIHPPVLADEDRHPPAAVWQGPTSGIATSQVLNPSVDKGGCAAFATRGTEAAAFAEKRWAQPPTDDDGIGKVMPPDPGGAERSGQRCILVFQPPYELSCYSWGETVGIGQESHSCNRYSGAIGAFASGFIGGATAEAFQKVNFYVASGCEVAFDAEIIRTGGTTYVGIAAFAGTEKTWVIDDWDHYYREDVDPPWGWERIIGLIMDFVGMLVPGSPGTISEAIEMLGLVEDLYSLYSSLAALLSAGDAEILHITDSFYAESGWHTIYVGLRANASAFITGSGYAVTAGQVVSVTVSGSGLDCPEGACCYQDACFDGYDQGSCEGAGGTYQGDGTTCTGGSCLCGEVADCNGNCVPTDWIGDGYCDDGAYTWHGVPIHLDCDAFDCDGGDCDPATHPCTPDEVGACCYQGACFDGYDQAGCEAAGGTYQGDGTSCTGGSCLCGEIPDCNWNCAPASWVGDGYCDDGVYEWHGVAIHLDCDVYECDGGDCDPTTHPDCDDEPPPPGDLIATEAWMSSQSSDWDQIYVVDPPDVGQEVYPHFSYQWTGTSTCPTHRVELRIDDDIICAGDMEGMLPESTMGICCSGPWTATSGSHTLTGATDTLDEVSEPSESNNETHYAFTSGSPPEPDINCEDLSAYDFGSVTEQDCSGEHTWSVTNEGVATLTGNVSITGSHSTQFQLTEGGGSFSLNPGQTRMVRIRFCPTSTGSKYATLHITSNDPDENPCDKSLTGSGEPVPEPDINCEDLSDYYFGTMTAFDCSSEYTWLVMNEGDAPLSGSILLTGTHATHFELTEGGGPFTLNPGQTRTVRARFCPTSEGSKSATLHITSNDPDENPCDKSLSGYGEPEPEPDINCEDLYAYDFGTVTLGDCSPEHTWTVVNEGDATLTGTVALSGVGAVHFDVTQGVGSFSLAPAQTRIVKVRFCPTSAGAKSASLYITSNDPDENPCEIPITGSGEETGCLLYDMNYDGLVSIIFDVPPFVQVVYYGDYAWYEEQFPGRDPVCPGDCNGDGFLSIVGDVPCFVDCLYFGDCIPSGADDGATRETGAAQTFTIGGAVYADLADPLTSGLERVAVTAILAGNTGRTFTAATAGDSGLWRIDGVPAGTYTIRAALPGYTLRHVEAGSLTGHESTKIIVNEDSQARNGSIQFLAAE